MEYNRSPKTDQKCSIRSKERGENRISDGTTTATGQYLTHIWVRTQFYFWKSLLLNWQLVIWPWLFSALCLSEPNGRRRMRFYLPEITAAALHIYLVAKVG